MGPFAFLGHYLPGNTRTHLRACACSSQHRQSFKWRNSVLLALGASEAVSRERAALCLPRLFIFCKLFFFFFFSSPALNHS
mmetsp:Transcript_11527/g.36972  ORF Transcript_11527/g.36972 Transcript_11527/m.36972 type:complete len:81 (-) Transcript_11527:27-269(-)